MLRVDSVLLCCAEKEGCDKRDYEDAFTPLYLLRTGDERFRVAIADGATESSFAKEWARALVLAYQSANGEDMDFIEKAKGRWNANINSKNLSWFAEEKFQKGAFATFLGIFVDRVKSTVQVVAVGDSCLLHIRGGRLINSFPMTQGESFTNNPLLVSSKLELSESDCKRVTWKVELGDALIMATDALAAHLLDGTEPRPWTFFFQLLSEIARKKEKRILRSNFKKIERERKKLYGSAPLNTFAPLVFGERKYSEIDVEKWSFSNWIFRCWLARERKMKRIKNDDTTLYCITFS